MILGGAVLGQRFLLFFVVFSVFFFCLSFLLSVSDKPLLLLILTHTFILTQPRHLILKVTPSIWENLWSVRQFIQSVNVLRIRLRSCFEDEH